MSRSRFRVGYLIALLTLVYASESFVVSQPAPIGTVGLTSGWATFGEVVPQGVAHNALQVGALPTQTDVKNRWPDGSIRFAVVTVEVPAAGSYEVNAAPMSSGGFAPQMPSASVTLTVGGVPYTASLPATAPDDVWLNGPLVREGRSVIAPRSSSGAAHPFLRANFDARVYADGKARVDLSVENILDKAGATTVTYDVSVAVGGQIVFTKRGVRHSYLTRWRKIFEVGTAPLASVTPDLTPFNQSKALPPYLPLVTNVVSSPTGDSYDILGPGALTANMRADGARPELAPYPDWTARYLVHKDPTQRSFVLVNGDLSGSWPVHVREAESSATSGVGAERLVSLNQRPDIWLDPRAQGNGHDYIRGGPIAAGEQGRSARQGPEETSLIPDNAHQPSLAYVPYLLTGDRYYAEEMAFWANYSLLRTDNRDGVRGSEGILASNEVSGFGWALRNLVDAAAYYPDGTPVKAYLSQKLTSNLGWLDAYANAQGRSNPFKVLWLNKRRDGGQYISLWEQNELAYAIDRANKQGFIGGTAHRDAIAQFQLMLFTSDPEYPRAQAAPQVVAVGLSGGRSFRFFQTMAQIWSGTSGNERPFAGYHGPGARLSLMMNIESGRSGAREAYDYLWPFIGAQPVRNGVPDLAQRAGWALDFYEDQSEIPSAPAPTRHAGHAVIGDPTFAVAAFTLPENIPDFSQDTSRPAVESAQSGSWSSPSTWQGGQVPTANHVVRILQGHTVTIDDTLAVAYTIAIDGKLAFATAVNTRLKVTNIEVMAGNMGTGTPGVLEVGTATNPIAANVSAEVIVANSPLGGSVADTDQYGTGIVVFGKVTMHGSVKTPTFVRLATEPRAGNTSLTLSEPVSGWNIGDRLVLPDTRHIKESEVTGGGWINAVNQWEERVLQAISLDGRTLTLNTPLQYDHLGARDLNNVLDFLPHLGNLTRNVIVRSEAPVGTRGHMLAIRKADVDIRYALFKDLGRTTYLPLNNTTNHIGRYPIHMHHLSGPQPTPANGYQFTLVGNAVDGGSLETKFKWGITVHGTHYGAVQDNVVYNYNGAAIATEDGSESFNVFDHNFVLRGMGEPNDSVSEARMALGTEGVGFWFRGPNNYVRNNVAANYQNPTTEAAYGFVFQFRYLGNIAVPNFKGADTMDPAQSTIKNGNNMPLLQFENNEAYGAMQGGFTIWWVSSQDPQPYANAQETIIKDLKLWNTYNKTVYMYPAQKVIFDGLKIRGSFSSLSRCCGNGVYFADYSSKGHIIRNSDIQGMEEGITAPEAGFGPEPNLTIENSYLRNYSNLLVPTVGSVNGCWMTNKLVVSSNTRFAAPPGRILKSISMVRDVAYAPECLSKLDETRVYVFNGDPSDNFQVYHTSSSVLPRPPSSCTPTTRADISGLLCPIPPLGPVPPTATFSASPTSITTGQSATLTWNTSNATTVMINQDIGAVAASGSGGVSPTATTTYTLTATNSAGTVSANATVTVTAPPPPTLTISNVATTNVTTTSATVTWTTNLSASSQIDYGATTTYGTTASDAALVTSHALALSGLSPATTYHYKITGVASGGGSATTGDLTFMTLSASPPASGHTATRANSYDDAWQDGVGGWVENAKAILAGGTGQTSGMVLWIGDSLTRDPALGAWAQRGAGKTPEDQAITDWMHAGLSPQSIDSIDGFALATPYICSARSYTVGDGLGSWDFMGGSMPADSDPVTARQKLQDCATYPNALNLTTILAAIAKPQFAIPEVNLDAARPGVFPDFERMVDLMISKHIVPIIITYTYRTDAAFNQLVDQYNVALVQYARNKKLPLIDFNNEMLLRLPFSQWPGRFLSDGVHYTRGTSLYPSTSDPYADGGDPATHATGLPLTYDGYGLKGWLGVQKMKEIKQLVIDTMAPPSLTITSPGASNITSTSATINWTTSLAASSQVDYGTTTAYGGSVADPTLVTSHSLALSGLSPSTTYHYRITSQASVGNPVSSGDLIVTTANPPDTTPPTVASTVPVAGATGVSTTTTVTATFNEAMNASTINASTFVVRNPANAVVPATVSYSSTTRRATLTPTQALSASTTYTVTLSSPGATDLAGNSLASNYVWSFSTGAVAPAAVTIWSAAASPAAIATNDPNAVELGVKFRSDVDGTVVGVRFYKGQTSTGTHTGTLWSSTGAKLATATFTGESATGWQQVTFATPVAITANTTYVVSYHTNVGNYAYTAAYFASKGVDTPPLHAPANSVSGGNGVFRYGASASPSSTYNSNNYWVDVVFVPR